MSELAASPTRGIDRAANAAGGEPAIVASELGKRYGDVLALDGVSFSVATGSVLGLLGPNGAGKTTAVRILTTLLRPDRGRARVLGHDVQQEPHRVRAAIGLAGQYAALDENLTARENLRLVGRLTHIAGDQVARRSEELLRRFDLTAAADRLVRTYSGGMRRRLDLAAALVHQPAVLFLDEPTTGLDPQGRAELWRVIEEQVAEGTTVLLTTQYLEEADRLAHRIIVIDHGHIIAQGTAAELKASMGATVIEVAFRDATAVESARTRLAALGPVSVAGRTVHVGVAEGPRAMLETVRLLDAAGLTPLTLALHEPTLDDVFLNLTGHVAEEPGAADAPAPTPRRGAKGSG